MVLENMEKIRPQVDIRRNSTGSFSMKANQALTLPLPNYLRASMGSCHDYCKYGIKPEFVTKTRPPVLPANKISQLVNSENVKTKNSTSQAKKEVIQQKLKQKAIIPKQPNIELKMETLKKEVSQPQNRRYSDVGIQTRSFRNGWSNDVKNASKGEPKFKPTTTSRSVKRDSKNAPPKGLPQSKNKPNKAKTMTEEQSFEMPVEKILYVAEITPPKQHACCLALSVPQETEERNDSGNLQALSLSVPQETEDMSNIVKAIDLVQLSEDSVNSGMRKGLLRNGSSSDSLASVTIISCEPDSDSSPRNIEFKKDNIVDDQCDKCLNCESTETVNESTKVVLQHQNPEEKRLPENLCKGVIEETARKLVETRKNKVKALVSAFEALISLEDNKSSGTAKNMILSPV